MKDNFLANGGCRDFRTFINSERLFSVQDDYPIQTDRYIIEVKQNMKAVFLTQYYPPEVGAPQSRISELVRRFADRGHDITVLTAMPNYPSGKILPGYSGLLRVERDGKSRIVRTFIYPTIKADLLRRLASYLSFVVSSPAFGLFLLSRGDYMIVESPPLFLGISGFILSRVKRMKMIFNVSDLWPESAVHVGAIKREGLAFRVSETLESLLYKSAWLVSGQSKTIVGSIKARFPSVETFHLSNGADTTRFRPDLSETNIRQSLSPNDECTVVYAGLHGLAQGLEQILAAAKSFSENSGCRFVLVGDGPDKKSLVSQAENMASKNVFFWPPRPSEEMPALLCSADIIIIPLKKYIPGAVPSKLYESMASARPVVLVADGEAAEIVRRHNAGIVVAPGDIAGIVRAIELLCRDKTLRETLGANGRIAAERNYDRKSIADRFIEFLENRN